MSVGEGERSTPVDNDRAAYLPADVYNRLMAHLMGGGREGLLLAGELQTLTGASALRRRASQGESRDAAIEADWTITQH